MAEKKTGLELLREPFKPNQISKLPKGTKAQNECPADQKVNCEVCGGWHHPRVRHLDYVGHAALTDRLLDADPNWSWEPLAFNDKGLPQFDETGGLWGKLTVCGVTRLGYGHAEGKAHMDKGAREKECIGDFLRNAAMRFGAALDLWHKGDLHADDEPDPKAKDKEKITPTSGVLDDLSREDRQAWEEVATDITTRVKLDGPEKAAAKIADLNLDNAQKEVLWALLDAPTRRELKKVMRTTPTAKTPESAS